MAEDEDKITSPTIATLIHTDAAALQALNVPRVFHVLNTSGRVPKVDGYSLDVRHFAIYKRYFQVLVDVNLFAA